MTEVPSFINTSAVELSVKFDWYSSSSASEVLWSLMWLLMVRNSPSEQPWITKEEVEYIELSLAGDLQSKV